MFGASRIDVWSIENRYLEHREQMFGASGTDVWNMARIDVWNLACVIHRVVHYGGRGQAGLVVCRAGQVNGWTW